MMTSLDASLADLPERRNNIVGTGEGYALNDVLEVRHRSAFHMIAIIGAQLARDFGNDLTQMEFLRNVNFGQAEIAPGILLVRSITQQRRSPLAGGTEQ